MSDRNIRWAEVITPSKDVGPYKLTEIETDGKRMDIDVVEPHGLQSVPHKGGKVLVLVPDGDEGKAVGIIMPRPKDRIDGQKEGETRLQNHDRGQYVYLDDNGDIRINSPNSKVIIESASEVTIKTGKLKIEADVEIKGNVTMEGNFDQTGVHTDSNGLHA